VLDAVDERRQVAARRVLAPHHPPPVEQHRRPLLLGQGVVLLHLLHRLAVDDRPREVGRVQRVADPQPFGRRHQLVGEFVVEQLQSELPLRKLT